MPRSAWPTPVPASPPKSRRRCSRNTANRETGRRAAQAPAWAWRSRGAWCACTADASSSRAGWAKALASPCCCRWRGHPTARPRRRTGPICRAATRCGSPPTLLADWSGDAVSIDYNLNDTLATPRSGLPPPNFGPATRRRNTIQDLRGVMVVTQLTFSLALATLLALFPAMLLLLNRELSISTAQYLFGFTIVS